MQPVELQPISGRPVVQIGTVVDDLEPALERDETGSRWSVAHLHARAGDASSSSIVASLAASSMLLGAAGEGPIEPIQLVEGRARITHWVDRRGPGSTTWRLRSTARRDAPLRWRLSVILLLQLGLGSVDGDGGFADLDTQDDLGLIVEGRSRKRDGRRAE